jgi:alpha-aminoadipic semialdehyde synthase
MKKIIAIRREDKNIWERRVPIIPIDCKKLLKEYGINVIVQPFKRRAFSDSDFEKAGAVLEEDLSESPVILGVKEIPIELLLPEKIYLFFSHTIKGQSYNMPLLQKLIDLKCTLIDYEKIEDEEGRRLVAFGRFAGLAGMIDALYGFGQRLKSKNIETPFLKLKPAYEYEHTEDSKNAVKKIAEEINKNGLPEEFSPYVFGFAGYGKVSKGAQEIFDLLPYREISPDELKNINKSENKKLLKVVFEEKHLVKPKDSSQMFELQDYYKHPEKYISKFEEYLPYLSVLVNAIYWDTPYPKLVTKEFLKYNYKNLRLQVICDITCDIEGSIEITSNSTESDNPAYVYNPADGTTNDGYIGEGIVDIAVDNLPTELFVDSSIAFSHALTPFIPSLVNSELTPDFNDYKLTPELKRAVIVYQGRLTPDFEYLRKYL